MDIRELSDLELDRVSGGKIKKDQSTVVSMGMFGTFGFGTVSNGKITADTEFYTPGKA